MSHSQFCKSKALSHLNSFSAKWSGWDQVRNYGGGIANKFANKLLRYRLKVSKLTANKRMWYVSINNRLWVKFSANRCDFLINERTEVVRKFRFRNVTGGNGTFAVSKQLISQPIQLLAWIALWQFVAKVFTFSRKTDSFFFTFLCSVKICLWTVRPLDATIFLHYAHCTWLPSLLRWSTERMGVPW